MKDASTETEGSRLPGWLFLVAFGGIPIIILSVVAVLFDISSRGGTAPSPYSAVIQGRIPAIQHLNRRVHLDFSVRNTGATIPETVLLFGGLEAWNITGARGSGRARPSSIDTLGNGIAWQFGPLHKNTTLHVTMEAQPARVGNPLVTLKAFAGVDSSGSPDPTVEIRGDGESWSHISITR